MLGSVSSSDRDRDVCDGRGRTPRAIRSSTGRKSRIGRSRSIGPRPRGVPRGDECHPRGPARRAARRTDPGPSRHGGTEAPRAPGPVGLLSERRRRRAIGARRLQEFSVELDLQQTAIENVHISSKLRLRTCMTPRWTGLIGCTKRQFGAIVPHGIQTLPIRSDSDPVGTPQPPAPSGQARRAAALHGSARDPQQHPLHPPRRLRLAEAR
jgi:hypothetical protein